MTKKLFVTVRRHEGDKPYNVGDFREATASVVKHLIPKVLREATKEELEEFKGGALSVGATAPEVDPAPEAKKLTDIRGVGKGTAAKLVEAGIDSPETLAALSPERAEELEEETGLKVVSFVEAALELTKDDEEE